MTFKNAFSILMLFITFSLLSQENLYSSLTIPVDLKLSANAVVRLNNMELSIESKQKVIIRARRIVTVLNEKGNRYIDAGSGYDKYVKIKKIEAYVYNDVGKEIKKFKKKDFIDHSAVDGGTLYSDSRVLFMGYTPISYPYTVEFICEIETSNTATIPTWRPIDDYYLSIEKDNYVVNDFANLGLRIKENNFDDFDIIESNTATTVNYSIENVVSVKPEDLSPTLHDFTPQAYVAVEDFHYNGLDGKAKNWLEFGDWINKSLLKGRDEVSLETKEKILNIVKDIEDPIEKAKAIYGFVQNNTRYISVQVGIGGIQPIPAIEVDELKYGDCKGLTNYTKALLDIAGVKSYYTIVEAGQGIVDFDDDFASLEQGNHIILGIPNDDEMIWVDCTSQIHPFGFIGDFTDNRNVLIVDENSSKVIKTTKYLNNTNRQYSEANIVLNSNASIDSEVEVKTTGIQYDNRFFIERESKEDVTKYYKRHWSDINNLDIKKYVFENNKDSVVFTEKLNIHAENYASKTGDRLIFSANVFNKNNFVPDRYRNRKLPLKIQRGYLDEDVYRFILPEGYTIESIPENISIENKFGKYEIEYIVEENEIVYKRKILILNGTYPKTEYEAYRNFRKTTAKWDKSKIVLIKN